jgi:predicted transcriptional regulator
MTLGKIIEILEAEVISGAEELNAEISSACSTDLMSDLLRFSRKPQSVLITGLANSQVVRTCEIADIKAIVFVLDKRPDAEIIEMAREKGIALIVTSLSKFTSCGRLYAAGLRSSKENSAV